MSRVIGYTYDAAEHCVMCAERRFHSLHLRDRTARDSEGNEPHAIFSTDEREPSVCECGDDIE